MSKDYTNAPPEGWKTYDQFVVDMNTYRLPRPPPLRQRGYVRVRQRCDASAVRGDPARMERG